MGLYDIEFLLYLIYYGILFLVIFPLSKHFNYYTKYSFIISLSSRYLIIILKFITYLGVSMLFDRRPKLRREDFYNREKELQLLSRGIDAGEGLIIVYGIGRIGKTSFTYVDSL